MTLHPSSMARSSRWSLWLPTPGNVIFTLIVVIGILWAQSAGALALLVTPPPINIPYQGRLADRAGVPLGGNYKMTFALYNVASGGAPLWSESYQDGNSVRVNNGLFNVLLGSLAPLDPSVITANPELYLGVTIDSDAEMTPRVKLGSVPFATQAWTIPDGLITTAKLAANAVTSPHIADGNVTSADLANNAVGTAALADQAVTQAKLAADVKLSLPSGSVVMWSKPINEIPSDWQLCDGTNGMPDLRDRFVVGAGATYATGTIGGVEQVTLSAAQMPSHNHTGVTSVAGDHAHQVKGQGSVGSGGTGFKISSGATDLVSGFVDGGGAHTHIFTTANTGGNQPFDNRPPYYALALICKK